MDTKKIRLLKNLSTGLVIVSMIFAFLIAGIRIFGVQVYGVLTGSMEPTYPTGSLIYVRRVDADDLRVNDVITFSMSANVIATHRIVEIVPDESNPSIVRYRTKGDANNDVDASLVNASNIIGKVMFSVPQMGYVANFIQHPPGIYVAILICGLMVAFVFYTDALENRQKEAAARRNGGRRNDRALQQRTGAPRPAQQRPRQSQPARQNGAYRQNQYPRRSSAARPDSYSRPVNSARQSGYSRQDGYPRQSSPSRPSEYPRQRTYPQRESSRQDEYSYRSSRSGRA